MYLANAGFIVDTLAGGADAVDFVRSATPDLVVLDLGLPDLDGWEIARRLKYDEQTRGSPSLLSAAARCSTSKRAPCEPAATSTWRNRAHPNACWRRFENFFPKK